MKHCSEFPRVVRITGSLPFFQRYIITAILEAALRSQRSRHETERTTVWIAEKGVDAKGRANGIEWDYTSSWYGHLPDQFYTLV